MGWVPAKTKTKTKTPSPTPTPPPQVLALLWVPIFKQADPSTMMHSWPTCVWFNHRMAWNPRLWGIHRASLHCLWPHWSLPPMALWRSPALHTASPCQPSPFVPYLSCQTPAQGTLESTESDLLSLYSFFRRFIAVVHAPPKAPPSLRNSDLTPIPHSPATANTGIEPSFSQDGSSPRQLDTSSQEETLSVSQATTDMPVTHSRPSVVTANLQADGRLPSLPSPAGPSPQEPAEPNPHYIPYMYPLNANLYAALLSTFFVDLEEVFLDLPCPPRCRPPNLGITGTHAHVTALGAPVLHPGVRRLVHYPHDRNK